MVADNLRYAKKSWPPLAAVPKANDSVDGWSNAAPQHDALPPNADSLDIVLVARRESNEA